jgi:hypothetical protein
MKFAITQNISLDVLNRFKNEGNRVDIRLGEYLTKQFASKDYGKGITAIYAGLNCVNPEIGMQHRDFETGLVVGKKYAKAKKTLEFQVKLSHSEISKANENQLIDIITEALLKSYSEVAFLNIKDFDIGKFYADLKKLLTDRAWLSESYVEKEFHHQPPQQKSKTKFSSDEKISEFFFWELIEKARADSQGNFYDQMQIVTTRLSKRDEREIIGFECMLRDLLMRAYHYNVMAVQKIVEGSVSDDSFLYFRCKLILYGRMTFENAINNPNNIFERIDPTFSGEPLLLVADTAFKMKFGADTEKVLPRDYASELIDYDFGEYEVQGKDWNEEDIPKRYSKLWKAYAE